MTKPTGDGPGPDSSGSDEPGYWEQQARERGADQQGGYEQGGYEQGGYEQGGYEQGGPAQEPPGQYPYQQGAPGPYGPPGGPAPAGYYAPPRHPNANTALILGIVGLLLCQLVSPFAWLMGRKALTEIEAAPGQFSGAGEAKAGWVCGIIGTAFLGLGLAIGLGFLVIALIAAVSVGSTAGTVAP